MSRLRKVFISLPSICKCGKKEYHSTSVEQRSFTGPKLVSGFTLIELLVVISIISLLSTVIFAVFSTNRVQAQDAKKKEEVHSVQQALELYHSQNNAYPPNYTCDSQGTCITGRAFPAIQGDTVNYGDLAYKKSMQELVTAGVLPSIPESTGGAGYAYYNTGSEAIFFTNLIETNEVFPSTARFYATDVGGQYPEQLVATLQSVNGETCSGVVQPMALNQSQNAYNRTAPPNIMTRLTNTRITYDNQTTWRVYLRKSSSDCTVLNLYARRAVHGDNPMGDFYFQNTDGTLDSSKGIVTVTNAN